MVAVNPGTDAVLETYTRILDALVGAVMEGTVSEGQIDQSLMRVLRLRQSLALD